MTTDWREQLRDKIAANPLASSGPLLEVSGVVEVLDDAATRRAGAMQLKYNSEDFLGLAPRHLQLLSFDPERSTCGGVKVSLRFRYFRCGSIGAGSQVATRPTDMTDGPSATSIRNPKRTSTSYRERRLPRWRASCVL